MEHSKTVANRRLRQITIFGFLLMLLMGVRVGYMTLFSERDVTRGEKEVVVNANVIADMEERFNLDLRDYHKYDMDDLIKVSEIDESTLSLIGLINQACSKKCIGQPTMYINFDHGYIFYKEADGRHVVLEVKRNSEWEVKNKQSKEDLLNS